MLSNETIVTGRHGIVEKITEGDDTHLWAYNNTNDTDRDFPENALADAAAFAGISPTEIFQSRPSESLRQTIATLNPNGCYADEVRWAKEELDRRGVDYSDCLEPAR